MAGLPTSHPAGNSVRLEAQASGAECPYPGLASFGREQAKWFFGRDHLTAELIELLDGRLRTGGIQMVMAPSGAGRSSLLRAGLLAKLGDGALPGSGRWPATPARSCRWRSALTGILWSVAVATRRLSSGE